MALSIEEQEVISNDVSYDSTISRDVEDAKAEEIFTGDPTVPAEEAPKNPTPTEPTPVEDSKEEIDPFPA